MNSATAAPLVEPAGRSSATILPICNSNSGRTLAAISVIAPATTLSSCGARL